MATVHNVVDTLMGNYDLQAKDVSPTEWAQVIRKTLDSLYLKHMKGFKSIKDLYKYDGGYGIARVFNIIPRTFISSRLLDLADIVAAPHEWKDFPKESVEGLECSEISESCVMLQRSIAVDRSGRLYEVAITWKPCELWTQHGLHESASQWAEAEVATCVPVTDQYLASAIETHPEIVGRVFCRLFQVVREWNNDLEFRLEHSKRAEHSIERIQRVTWR